MRRGGAQKTRRVLVVGEELSARYGCSELLGLHGYEVLACADGADALRRLRRGAAVDVVIVEVGPAQPSGWQLLRSLRQLGLSSTRLPVVAVGAIKSPLNDFAAVLPELAQQLVAAVAEAVAAREAGPASV